MQISQTYLNPFLESLEKQSLNYERTEQGLMISSATTKVTVFISNDYNINGLDTTIYLPIDYLITSPNKATSILLSKLNLNKTIFARNCQIQKITKEEANHFFKLWHFFNATTSAYNYGLFYKKELVGAASFSKGRNMNRLPSGLQSFELIRFCCKSGITITGGLSKLMKHFCEEKKAGDIMTYVDKQFSNGAKSYIKAGFKVHSETPPLYFIVNKESYERTLLKKDQEYNSQLFYLTQNLGNIKLVYTPNEL